MTTTGPSRAPLALVTGASTGIDQLLATVGRLGRPVELLRKR